MISDTVEQQKPLLMTNIMSIHPIALITLNNWQHYLLKSSFTIKEPKAKQHSVNFTISLLQQKTTADNITEN